LRRGLQSGCGLLEGIEQKSGATVIDAVVGKSVNDLLNAGEHGMHVVEDRHLEVRPGLTVQASMSGLYATGANIEVEVAITLVAKSGRTAVDAILLEMVTSPV
jgi:hypothetical protein